RYPIADRGNIQARAATLGGRAHLCLAWTQPSSRQKTSRRRSPALRPGSSLAASNCSPVDSQGLEMMDTIPSQTLRSIVVALGDRNASRRMEACTELVAILRDGRMQAHATSSMRTE